MALHVRGWGVLPRLRQVARLALLNRGIMSKLHIGEGTFNRTHHFPLDNSTLARVPADKMAVFGSSWADIGSLFVIYLGKKHT
jgi:uncharacterized membrane protein